MSLFILVAMLAGGSAADVHSAKKPDPTPADAPSPEPDAKNAEAKAAGEPASTLEAENAPPSARGPNIIAGVKVGGIFPQVLGRMQTGFIVSVELGWVLPVLQRHLGIELEVSYSQPPYTNSSLMDPRVPGGSYSYSGTEQILSIFLGPKVFIFPPDRALVPFLALGLRAQFVGSQIGGTAMGNDFGGTHETATHLAYGGQLGLGYHLGPGLLEVELQMISSPILQQITGAANIGDLAVRAGYLFTL